MMGEEGVGSPFSPWETNRLFMCLVQRGTYKYVGCQLLLWSGRDRIMVVLYLTFWEQ